MEASGAEGPPSDEGAAEGRTSAAWQSAGPALVEAPGSLPPGASSAAPDAQDAAQYGPSRAVPGEEAGEQDLGLLPDMNELARPAAPGSPDIGEPVSCTPRGQPGEAAAEHVEAAAEGAADCGRDEAGRAEAEQGAAPTGNGDCWGAAACENPYMGGYRDRRTGEATASHVRHM